MLGPVQQDTLRPFRGPKTLGQRRGNQTATCRLLDVSLVGGNGMGQGWGNGEIATGDMTGDGTEVSDEMGQG